jgi:hypothetical protein
MSKNFAGYCMTVCSIRDCRHVRPSAKYFRTCQFESFSIWYVLYYSADKALIKAGPWAFGHDFFIETKEHVFLMFLLLALYLPIAASGKLSSSKAARKIVLWVARLIVPISLSMEASGPIISIAVKVTLPLKK